MRLPPLVTCHLSKCQAIGYFILLLPYVASYPVNLVCGVFFFIIILFCVPIFFFIINEVDYQKIKFCISFISPMSYLSETPHAMYNRWFVGFLAQTKCPDLNDTPVLVYSLINHPILQMYVLI